MTVGHSVSTVASTSSTQTQLMKGILTDTALPLGDTPHGKMWCTKALHPADLESPTSGIPDRKSMPSAILQFNNTYKVQVPTKVGTDTTYHADLHFNAGDILSFGKYVAVSGNEVAEPITQSATEGTGTQRYFLNGQMAGTGATQILAYADKLTRLTSQSGIREYRPNYFGVTVRIDAPALANQGVVSATQFPFTERNYTAPCVDYTAPAKNYLCREVKVYSIQFPSFDSLQNLPGVYNGKAKDGVYMPLKLDEDDFVWKSVDDARVVHSKCATLGTETDGAIEMIAGNYDHPYAPVPEILVAPDTGLSVMLMKLPCSKNSGMIAIRGLDFGATITVHIRAGYEITCAPGSMYSPNVSKPVSFDPVAIDNYFAISRQMADAYPESYNSLGTILTVIGGLASTLLPIVSPYIKAGGEWLYNKFHSKSEPTPPKMTAPAVARQVRLLKRSMARTEQRSYNRVPFGSSPPEKPQSRRKLRLVRRV